MAINKAYPRWLDIRVKWLPLWRRIRINHDFNQTPPSPKQLFTWPQFRILYISVYCHFISIRVMEINWEYEIIYDGQSTLTSNAYLNKDNEFRIDKRVVKIPWNEIDWNLYAGPLFPLLSFVSLSLFLSLSPSLHLDISVFNIRIQRFAFDMKIKLFYYDLSILNLL